MIFWDILFGTFHLPKGKRADENIGVRGMPEFPKSWSGLMLVPFTYGSLKREARLPERTEALEVHYAEQSG